jgi:D-alanyl-lipoteichoic acid acyltransferase DltB (MBOAT superfamily)
MTFFVVTFLWVIFRADSMENAIQVIKLMFTIHTGISQPYTWSFVAYMILLVAIVMAYKKSMTSEENKVSGY